LSLTKKIICNIFIEEEKEEEEEKGNIQIYFGKI